MNVMQHLITEYNQKGIDTLNINQVKHSENLPYRDAYYRILRKINRCENVGHAICLVGLQGTGKKTILNQLHLNSQQFGVPSGEVLHITLSVIIDGKKVTRDELNCARISNANTIEYPSLDDVKQFIMQIRAYKNISCVMIDEITLCEDLIIAGKGFIDYLVNSGLIVILAGTESASFNLANDMSLYSRLILEDISYIPFGEYCRLKKLSLSTLEEKQQAIDKYIEHGNILDDTVDLDDRYIESALGVNVALSIINADLVEFIGCEHYIKDLVESIIKYYKCISIEKQAKNITNLGLSMKQVDIIDKILNDMGLFYDISEIPRAVSEINGAVDLHEIKMLSNYSLSDILTLQLIKAYEKDNTLIQCLKKYGDNGYCTGRKCTKRFMYKYNNKIIEGDIPVKAEVDIVIADNENINLIEVKKSTQVDEHQTRWLNNNTVIDEIRAQVSETKDIQRYVYYIGENTEVGNIHCKNIVDILLEHYNKHFNKSI